MMRALLLGYGLLAVAAVAVPAQADPPRGAVYSNLDRNCQIYSDQVMIDGVPHTAYGHACIQPDGSLRLMHDAVVPQASPAPVPGAAAAGPVCVDHIDNCDRGCDDRGILGARHVHADCSRSCDLICGNREGYAPW